MPRLDNFKLLFAGIAGGIGAWAVLSPIFGETQVIKGVGFAVGGLVVSAYDVVIRWRSDGEMGKWRFVSSECGGWAVFIPAWALGLMTVWGGIAIMLGHSR